MRDPIFHPFAFTSIPESVVFCFEQAARGARVIFDKDELDPATLAELLRLDMLNDEFCYEGEGPIPEQTYTPKEHVLEKIRSWSAETLDLRVIAHTLDRSQSALTRAARAIAKPAQDPEAIEEANTHLRPITRAIGEIERTRTGLAPHLERFLSTIHLTPETPFVRHPCATLLGFSEAGFELFNTIADGETPESYAAAYELIINGRLRITSRGDEPRTYAIPERYLAQYAAWLAQNKEALHAE